MEDQIVLLDTSVLIDYYRKKNKNNTFLFRLGTAKYQMFAVSSITLFEIYTGANESQIEFWNTFFKDVNVIPFDAGIAKLSVKIDTRLKQLNKRIDKADLFIAATAISNNLPCATLNKKHFERIVDLQLID